MTAINSTMFDTPNRGNQSSNINQLSPELGNIAYQESDSLLAGKGVSLIYSPINTVALNYVITGNQSDKISSGYLANILAQYSANILAQQSAKTLADVSAKIYANQSGKYFSGYKSADILRYSNLSHSKRGEFTPFAKGDFSHLMQGLIVVTTRGGIEFLDSIKGKIIEFCESIKKGSYLATQFCQFFGSMPRLCNSFLIIRLIQADTDASPSCSRAVFIPFSSAGSTRRAICLFPLFVILVVDTCHTPFYILTVNQVYDTRKIKTTPSNDITSTKRGLITTDSIIIEVTMKQHNTPVTGRTSLTPNQSYRWLFLALNRSDYTAKPCRIAVTAPNEHDARLMLVRDYMLIFAGRLPVIGGKHHA